MSSGPGASAELNYPSRRYQLSLWRPIPQGNCSKCSRGHGHRTVLLPHPVLHSVTNRSDTCHPLPIQFCKRSPPASRMPFFRHVTSRQSLPHQLWTVLEIDVVDARVIWCAFIFQSVWWIDGANDKVNRIWYRSKFWIRLEAYRHSPGLWLFASYWLVWSRRKENSMKVVIYEFAGRSWWTISQKLLDR